MYSELIEKGYEAIKCHGKRPIAKNWTKMDIIDDPAWDKNCAIRTGEVYGLDLDIYDTDIAGQIMASAIDRFGKAPIRIGQAPKSLLVYRGVKGQKKITRSWADSTGRTHAIELLGKGQAFVAHGEHPDTLQPYSWYGMDLPIAEELPVIDFDDLVGWMSDLQVPKSWDEVKPIGKVTDLGDFKGHLKNDIPREQIISMLGFLNHNMENDSWVKVGMALKDWDSGDGLRLWEEWSYGGTTWKLGETARRWNGVDFGSRVAIGSLVYMAQEAGWESPTFRTRLNACANESQVNKLAKEIQSTVVDNKERDILSKLFAKKLKAIIGVPVAIKEVRDMLSGEITEDESSPDWCKNWVRVTVESAWYDMRNVTKHDTVGFNLLCTKYVNDDTAVNYVSKKGFVRTVNSIQYVPTSNERILFHEGHDVLNTFRYETVPETAASSNGVEKLIIEHIHHIMEKTEAEIIIKWMAWQVQHTGKMIRWSPIIQGAQGVGKSIIGNVMESVLGSANVGKVSTKHIESGWNDWATGSAVNIIEELKLKGLTRHEVSNELKPVITDKRLPINKRYSSGFTVSNYTNYIVFTNYKDAIPLEDNDRRWWPVFTTPPPQHEGYYSELTNAVSKSSELRAWLMTVDTTGFGDMKGAPFSEAKRMMIDTEENSYEGLSEAKALLNTGGEGFRKDVFVSEYFRTAFELDYGFLLSNKEYHVLFTKMGFVKAAKKFKYNGKSRVLWSKLPMSNVEYRKRLRGDQKGD